MDNFHDGLLTDIYLDFKKKVTFLTIENYLLDNDIPNGLTITRKLKFKDVRLQEFNGFNRNNIIFDVYESEDFEGFLKEHNLYLEKMRNYFEPGFLESIKGDLTLKYYFIKSSIGVEGFVICKEYEVSKID